jgi:hypothetical protein
MLLGVAQRLCSVVGLAGYLLHGSIWLHPRSLLETTIPKSKNGSVYTPPRGCPCFVSWDFAYPPVIFLLANELGQSIYLCIVSEACSCMSDENKSGK